MLSDVVRPRYRWRFPRPSVIDPGLAAAGRRHGLSDRVVALLASRGVADAAELDGFFGPPAAVLHDPARLPDADRFLERLRAARRRGETILVFGDFDADGLTGLATVTGALRAFGLDAEPYVPSRIEEGHGLSRQAIETAGASGRSIIVTVDCGTTSVDEIEEAVARGIDVLVTDHHRVPDRLPPALALVNPHRPDAEYPDRRLAGSGVAFKVAQLLLADEPDGPAIALGFADLATIGTVADVAPILGENRAIARLGLERLRTAPRPGLAALLARAAVQPASVDLETIAYVIAPRLNAAGRVGEAAEAADLLLAEDPTEAARLAETLEGANLTRREWTKQAVGEARLAAAELAAELAGEVAPGATIVRGPWPIGIVGLVAARLADDHGRPAVVGAEMGDVIRASCRSSGGFDLAAALQACSDLLIRHGGHAGAAGFELQSDRWPAFRERFLALAATTAPSDPRPELRIDLALPAPQVDYPLLAELARLAPTGPGNPDPLVAVLGLTVARVRLANGGHTQLTLRRDRDVLDGIAFGREDLAEALKEGDRVDVVARLMTRTFGGYESMQLEIRDVAACGAHAEAATLLAGLAEVGERRGLVASVAATGDASGPSEMRRW